MTVRRALSILIATAAALCVGLGLTIFISASDIDQTIAHNRKIDGTFREAAGFVSEWRRSNDRLPRPAEFAAWASRQPAGGYSAKFLQYSIGGFPDEVTAKFGQPTDEAYLLTWWRGEWNEYYVSWADTSSLAFDPAEYFMFGSRWLDLLTFGSAGLMLGWAAFLLWPSNKAVQLTRAGAPPG